MSLASVLVISVKSRTLSLNTLASASAAACASPASGSEHQVERRLERERLRLALDLEAQPRHGLAEQPVPGAVPRSGLLVEQPLELLVELIGLLLAQVVDPGPVAGERRHLQRLRQRSSSIWLSSSSKKMRSRGDGGHLLLDVAVELGARRVGRVGGVEQAGVGAEPAHHLAQALVGRDRGGEPVGGELGELALVGLLDASGLSRGLLQVACDRGRVGRGVEIGEVPVRQGAELGRCSISRPGCWWALGKWGCRACPFASNKSPDRRWGRSLTWGSRGVAATPIATPRRAFCPKKAQPEPTRNDAFTHVGQCSSRLSDLLVANCPFPKHSDLEPPVPGR